MSLGATGNITLSMPTLSLGCAKGLLTIFHPNYTGQQNMEPTLLTRCVNGGKKFRHTLVVIATQAMVSVEVTPIMAKFKKIGMKLLLR